MCLCYMMSSGEHLGFQMDDGAAACYCEEAGVLFHTIKEVSFQNFPSYECFSLLNKTRGELNAGLLKSFNPNFIASFRMISDF